MKIIEALTQIDINKKRMQRNIEQIQKYASGVDTERPYFDTEEKQREELKKLEQSTLDLWKENVRLGIAITITNAVTTATLAGKDYTLFELLRLKRQDGETLKQIYTAMSDNTGQQKMRPAQQLSSGEPVHLVRYYNEQYKNERLQAVYNLIEQADPRLQVINATTELLEINLSDLQRVILQEG
jgi:hypothetical protein